MITSTYNKEENIIYVERHGEIELHELLQNISDASKYFLNLGSLYVIEYVRKSITKFNENDYVIIKNTLKDLVEIMMK